MVEKSDEFDECMLNRQNFSHQNFALTKFRYCIFYSYNLLTLSLSGSVTLCRDMESRVLSSYYPCKKDTPEEKDRPKERSYPIYLG